MQKGVINEKAASIARNASEDLVLPSNMLEYPEPIPQLNRFPEVVYPAYWNISKMQDLENEKTVVPIQDHVVIIHDDRTL
jgi:hypothetical protein